MVIETLDENVISQIRSSSSIDSVTQCVNELVLNSLDAKATSVAVRVNLTIFRIQVVDNGRGISRSNLEYAGFRYMTNKCHSLEDLKKRLKYYGFKGEALANISKISQRVTITTREYNCEETFEKTIENNGSKIELVKTRPSFGTTVTVEGFLNSLPVRQQCIKNSELDNIKKSLESLIIIHPHVSFTLRNETTAKLILASVKCPDIASSFKTIHPEIDENNFALLKVTKNRTSVEGFIHNEFYETKRLQYIYLNKRPINCPKIQNVINLIFQKSHKNEKKKNPIFIIHIKCPYSDVDITLEPTKTLVFFKKFDIVKRCVEKMLNTLLGPDVHPETLKSRKVASEFGVSQIGGVVKGFGAKRKSDVVEETGSNKSAKIVEDTPFFEEPKIPSRQAKTALPIEIKRNERKEDEIRVDVADNSLFTNFPENEKKGKDVIMDMFIMSLKVFPPDEVENEERNKSGSSMSSVTNIPEEVSLMFGNKATIGVQTTLNDVFLPKSVSVGVQTDFNNMYPVADPNVTFFPRKPLTKFVSDYDFDFSKIDDFPPAFQPRKKYQEMSFFGRFEQTRKLFDFRDNCDPEFTFFGNFDPIIQSPPKEKISHVSKMHIQSPYFSRNTKTKNSLSQKKVLLEPKKLNKIEMLCSKRNKRCKRLNESSVSKYFTPKKKIKSQLKELSFDDSEDLFNLTSMEERQHSSSVLKNNIISIIDDEENKENVMCEKSVEDIIGPTLILPQNDWTKEVNDFGNIIYVNKKTGIKTLKSPQKDPIFEMTERFDFVPKGLSPLLKHYSQVDNMTPESKEHLQNAIVQSYDDELLVVKWQNYIDNNDPKKFFEEIYLEKSKLIESAIPNISKSKYAKNVKGFANMSFTKSLFQNLDIIGQVDCKFIAVLDKMKQLILLFDQHAVHERVRLEQLSEGYKNSSIKLDQSVTIFLPHTELRLIQRQQFNLQSLGLNLIIFANGITVSEVPLCVYNKSKKGVDIVSLTENLIKEIVESLKTNNGILVHTPRMIQNIVNSEACRGAIKFGDVLSKNECIIHLKNLSECQLPFQCAHGRPTLTPLLLVSNLDLIHVSKPNLGKLRRVR